MVTVSSVFLTFRSSGNLLQMHQPVASSKGKRKEGEKKNTTCTDKKRKRKKKCSTLDQWEGRVARAFAIINISPFITSTDYTRQNVTDYHFPDRSIYDFSNFPGRSFIARNLTGKNVLQKSPHSNDSTAFKNRGKCVCPGN